MNELINPKTMHKPYGMYSHTVKVPGNAESLAIAGQVGMNAKGDVKRQTDQALRNAQACLHANKLTKDHLVKLTIYLTDARHVEDMRTARSKVLDDAVRPASIFVIVYSLTAPEFLVEVGAWLRKADDL